MTRVDARPELGTIAALAIVGAVLYLAREFLIPVALAALLGFMLTPVVRRLERAGVPRVAAVIVISLAILSAASIAAWLIAREASDLVANLPDFRATFAEKLRALRGPVRSLADALGWIDDLGKEIDPAAGRAQAPQVEVVEPSSGIGLLGRYGATLLGPLGTAGIVAVIAIFILLQDDLPRRIATWLSLRDSRLSPRAVDEAGALVSRFLGRQAAVCLLQGLAVWLGLTLIGVPGAFVFGFISALFRSIPYFGPTTAAALPIAFSAAAFHGFEKTLWTAGFFACWELFTNTVVDPHVLGRGAGLTPLGVVLSATFWAWLWGAPGLFLAIPLTACLTVVGRYVPQLAFLPALLSHDPVAPPSARLYQTLAARDDEEAAALLRHAAQEGDLVQLSDAVVLPMLVQLSREREAGRASRGDVIRSLRSLRELLGELLATVPVTPAGAHGAGALRVEALHATAVDRFARDWVATVLERAGFRVHDSGRLASVSIGGHSLEVRGLSTAGGVSVLTSCAALVAALTPAPIARAEAAG